MKRILLINDLCGYGKVATTAMVPILSYMGVPSYELPTALVSNNLEYGKFEILETTDYIKASLKIWKELDFHYGAIATGFIVSERQAKIISDYCREQAAMGTAIYVDPIMGDEGKLYNGVTEGTIGCMRKMLSVAHLCFPNYTEACYITGVEYKAEGVTETEAFDIVDNLRRMGGRSVLVTSIRVDGETSVAGYNADTDEHFLLTYDEIPVRIPGTGDIFSAIVIGHLMNGKPLQVATRHAMDNVRTLIDMNKDMDDKYRGIPLERQLSVLDN